MTELESKPGGCLVLVAELCVIAILISCTVYAVNWIWGRVPW